MPVSPTYPGVYVQELPSGVRTIVGAATSVTAFVGPCARGPDNEAVTVYNWGDFSRRFGGLSTTSPLSYAVQCFFQNGGGTAVIVRVHNGATYASVSLSDGSGTPLKLRASGRGTWGKALRASVSAVVAGAVPADEAAAAFTLTLREVDTSLPSSDPGFVIQEEVFVNVSVDPDSSRYIERILEAQSLLARVKDLSDAAPTDVTDAPFIGGSDGSTVTDSQYVDAADPTFVTTRQGLYALDAVPTVNLVCIPPPSRTAEIGSTVWTAAIAWAEANRAIVLVDTPATVVDTASAAARSWLTTTSANAMFLWPRLNVADPLRESRPLTIAPCGAIAGVIARTDGARGVWKAAAGTDAGIVGILGLSATLDDDACGQLNPRAVNALRALPVVGPVVWGARTAQGDDLLGSQWKYVPVRRLALHIERSLLDGMRWAVFEPNDDALWSQLRASIGSFMAELFRQGAFAGTTQKEAYFVKCDAETTLSTDIDQGIVNVIVGFAPLRPAEFVILSFQQIAQAA